MTDGEFLERCMDFVETELRTPERWLGSKWFPLPSDVKACLWREHLRRWLRTQERCAEVRWCPGQGVWFLWLETPSKSGMVAQSSYKDENAALIAAVKAVMKKEQSDAG